jgi:hypothetical protein
VGTKVVDGRAQMKEVYKGVGAGKGLGDLQW